MKVKVQYVGKGRLPRYQTLHSAGADLYADLQEPMLIQRGERAIIPTGIALQIPVGYYGEIHDRSGWAAKHGITTLAGVIDSDYTGEINVVILNTGTSTVYIQPGDRIAQIIFKPYERAEFEIVNKLENTERGTGGFGSTGMGG